VQRNAIMDPLEIEDDTPACDRLNSVPCDAYHDASTCSPGCDPCTGYRSSPAVCECHVQEVGGAMTLHDAEQELSVGAWLVLSTTPLHTDGACPCHQTSERAKRIDKCSHYSPPTHAQTKARCCVVFRWEGGRRERAASNGH
jgi:hypothetical protein